MGQSDGITRATFMYFGYGSNLLTKRLRIQNPSAVRKNIGVLKVIDILTEFKFQTNTETHTQTPLCLARFDDRAIILISSQHTNEVPAFGTVHRRQ